VSNTPILIKLNERLPAHVHHFSLGPSASHSSSQPSVVLLLKKKRKPTPTRACTFVFDGRAEGLTYTGTRKAYAIALLPTRLASQASCFCLYILLLHLSSELVTIMYQMTAELTMFGPVQTSKLSPVNTVQTVLYGSTLGGRFFFFQKQCFVVHVGFYDDSVN
jgi:hypothetical protein